MDKYDKVWMLAHELSKHDKTELTMALLMIETLTSDQRCNITTVQFATYEKIVEDYFDDSYNTTFLSDELIDEVESYVFGNSECRM